MSRRWKYGKDQRIPREEGAQQGRARAPRRRHRPRREGLGRSRTLSGGRQAPHHRGRAGLLHRRTVRPGGATWVDRTVRSRKILPPSPRSPVGPLKNDTARRGRRSCAGAGRSASRSHLALRRETSTASGIWAGKSRRTGSTASTPSGPASAAPESAAPGAAARSDDFILKVKRDEHNGQRVQK